MIVVGLNGGFDSPHEHLFPFPDGMAHDASAVLLVDGKVVAAAEEERLTRIKHTNKFPVSALRYCLQEAGVSLDQVDRIAYYVTEPFGDLTLAYFGLERPDRPLQPGVRKSLLERLRRFFGVEVDPTKLSFVSHHVCHAATAFGMSGFDESLVVTLDGQGQLNDSGVVGTHKGTRFEFLHEIPASRSLGHFYLQVIKFLGYKQFDEYKVMGLAPYGDPSALRHLFASFFTLRPGGEWDINTPAIYMLLMMLSPRRRGEELTQNHKDIAAALQESLEKIAFHLLQHWKDKTGQRRLCLAGGVAHNCTMNGKILSSGLFDEVFVQPASHDAGCALGAALAEHYRLSPDARPHKLTQVYWGRDVGDPSATLRAWSRFVGSRRSDDVVTAAAELLAGGKVIGWVQGRSEFGPRALGNRSILADPRPAENKTVINAMVKKREGYRPFAPSVLEDHAAEYFEFPPSASGLGFMTFVVGVRETKRSLLGAVTHVDGTSRIQTVSKTSNPRYAALLSAFHERTGVPILLNTSFNNHEEPIVDTAEDAVVTFLTTGLDALVVGDHLVEKRPFTSADFLSLVPSIPEHVTLERTRRHTGDGKMATSCEIRKNFSRDFSCPVSPEVFAILDRVDGAASLRTLIDHSADSMIAAIVTELQELWSRRLIGLRPAAAAPA